MLNKIKLLLGITATDKDELLNLLIELCKEEAITFCHLDYYDNKLDTVVINMVIEKFNRIGNEGINTVNYSGVSESFIDDYSTPIVRQLKRHRRLIIC